MTKSQLIKALFQRHNNLSLKEAEIVVHTIFKSMFEVLKRGENIEIRGFGSFKLKNYDSYMGRNPKTGESIKVKDKKLPFFKVGKELRVRVNR